MAARELAMGGGRVPRIYSSMRMHSAPSEVMRLCGHAPRIVIVCCLALSGCASETPTTLHGSHGKSHTTGTIARIKQLFPSSAAHTRDASIARLQRGERIQVIPKPLATHSTARLADVSLPISATGEVRLTESASGAEITFRLREVSPSKAILDRGLIVYPNAFSRPGSLDGTLVHRPTVEGIEDYVLFERPPAREELRYSVDLGDAVLALRLVANTLEFMDSSGTPRLRMAPPYVDTRVGDRHEQISASVSVLDCHVNTGAAEPWNERYAPPGARTCEVVVSWHGKGVAYPALVDPAWMTTGSMIKARRAPLTRLANGRVLACSGTTCEIYDPPTGTWASTASMLKPRNQHTVTRLLDGRVLVVGGDAGLSADDAEILDLAASSPAWASAGTLANAHYGHTATLLASGKVLVAMGWTTGAAELFDPAASGNPWSSAGGFVGSRANATAILTPLGHVFVAGGTQNNLAQSSAVLYSSVGWSNIGSLVVPRASPFSALVNGQVFIVGSSTSNKVDVWNPTNGNWSQGPTVTSIGPSRMVQLVTGELLDYETDTAPKNEIFDPVALKWWSAPGIALPTDAPAVALSDGRVLIAGGGSPLSTAAFIFDPGATEAYVGGPCATTAVCKTGFCTDGVCCDAPCTGTCSSCVSANTGVTSGLCAPVQAGKDPFDQCLDDGSPACTANGSCDGAGTCAKYPVTSGCNPSPCTVGTECTSGHCVDGVCCDSACDAPCQACTSAFKGQGSDGVCGFIADGADPQSECGPVGSGICAGDGVCNGSGKCRAVSFGTICQSSSCSGSDSQNNAWTCSIDGVCTSAGVSSCHPFTCQGAACATTCTTSTDCATGAQCVAGVCNGPKPNASPCLAPSECASGWCVEGVCCDSVCDGACDSCVVASKAGGSTGTCGPRKADAPCGDPPACIDTSTLATSACDGAGVCKTTPISCAPSICIAGACVLSDAGVPNGGIDGGGIDAGSDGAVDAKQDATGSPDGGSKVPAKGDDGSSGCGCRIEKSHDRGALVIAISLLLLRRRSSRVVIRERANGPRAVRF